MDKRNDKEGLNMNNNGKQIQWMCTYCGRTEWRKDWAGRPMPGICSKRPLKKGPHRWVKNREMKA